MLKQYNNSHTRLRISTPATPAFNRTTLGKGICAVIATQNPSKKARGALPLPQKKRRRTEALLFSPSKVHRARQQHKADETRRLEEELSKHHRREEKAAKTLRNKLERERRSVAYAAKLEASKKKRAEEAAEKERKKQERDALKSIQLSQSGKRKTSQKAPPKARTKKRAPQRAQRGVVVEEPALTPRTVTTRSGRTSTRNY